MKTGRILLFVSCAFLILLPGCAGRRKAIFPQKRQAHSKKPLLSTNLDLPDAISEQKLDKIGISSRIGQEIAQKEQSEIITPTQPGAQEQEEIIEESTNQIPPVTQAEIPPQVQAAHEDEPSIEFHFENADLEVLMNQISDLFDVTFVADDSITPMLQNAKSVKGHKISFKTQRPLTRKEAWNLFLTFLELAGFTVINQESPKIKRIVTIENARKSPLQAYIGVDPSALPSSDEIIRYVYFIENASLLTIRSLVEQLRSPSAIATFMEEIKAMVITDKAYNIKSLMNIIKEIDKVTMPQAMSVLKLRRADAEEVEKLYKTLIGIDERSINQQRFLPTRRTAPGSYFPDNVGIFAEKRTNSLVLLGPADAIKRIEDFITQSVDVALNQPYSPLNVLPLRYADATTIANIMNDVVKFGANTEAGRAGGVRGGDKYLRGMVFTPEPETNRLIVKGDYEDFLKAKEIILELDRPQPQVAIEVLLLSVSLNERKQLGTQMRTRIPGMQGLLGNTQFQTSGLFGNSGIVENPNGNGVNRLLGNLLNLVSPGIAAGNTIISLGDTLSTWAIIQALESVSNVQVLSNPFLIATNKTNASVSLGEVRRLITGTIIGTQETNTFGDAPAALIVNIRPQINSDGMIVLDIKVELSQFVGQANPENAVRTTRKIDTKTIVANKEVLALGGLIQNNIENAQTKLPILGDIPILGWLFKNKQKQDSKSNLLILISSRIIEPDASETATAFTSDHLTDYTDTVNEMYRPGQRRDPVNRWFFAQKNINEQETDNFIFRQQKEAQDELKIEKDIVTPIAANKKNRSASPLRLPSSPTSIVAHAKNRRKPSLAKALESNKEVRA